MLFAPPDTPIEGDKEQEQQEDDRTDAQKQRDSIEVSDSTDKKDNIGSDNKDADDDNDDNDNDNDEDENEDDDEADENKEKNKNEEETDEQKSARIAKEKEDRREARVQKRIDKAVAAQRAAEARAEAAEAKLKEQPIEGLTEEEVQRRADALAATKLAEKQAQDNKKKFEDTCDNLEAVAIKTDKEFSRKVVEMTTEIGPIPAPIIEILAELDNENGGEVLAYLANNIDEAEDLFELKSNERKLTAKLVRISDKVKEASKKPKRERSNLPAPIEPVGNSRQESTRITGKETQEEFNAKRAKQEAEKRAARGY